MYGSRVRTNKRKALVYDLPRYTVENVRENVRQKTLYWNSNKQKKITAILNKIKELEEKNSALSHTDTKNYHDYMDNVEQIEILRKTIRDTKDDRELEEFVESVTPLLESENIRDTDCVKQQRNTLFLNLFYKSKANTTYFHTESCAICQKEKIICVEESLLMCTECGVTNFTVVSNNEERAENTDRSKGTPYERAPLYRKYLMQFHENAPDPPQEVIETIYKHLFKVHMMLSTKVKPTPIAQILRAEKLQRWAPYSVRISKVINKDHIVALTQELIDKLVYRFEKITKAFDKTKLNQRKKIMNFEFLTKQFLLMEDEPELARWFCCHKTRNVLNQADSRLYKCKKNLQADNLDWSIRKSC